MHQLFTSKVKAMHEWTWSLSKIQNFTSHLFISRWDFVPCRLGWSSSSTLKSTGWFIKMPGALVHWCTDRLSVSCDERPPSFVGSWVSQSPIDLTLGVGKLFNLTTWHESHGLHNYSRAHCERSYCVGRFQLYSLRTVMMTPMLNLKYFTYLMLILFVRFLGANSCVFMLPLKDTEHSGGLQGGPL